MNQTVFIPASAISIPSKKPIPKPRSVSRKMYSYIYLTPFRADTPILPLLLICWKIILE